MLSSTFVLRPDTFTEFGNGFTFVKNFKYEKYNTAGAFVKPLDEYSAKSFTKLNVRVLVKTDENTYLTGRIKNKIELGYTFEIKPEYMGSNTIYTSIIEQLQADIAIKKLKCIGVLRDISLDNNASLVFLCTADVTNQESFTPEELKNKLLEFEPLSRFILDHIDYIS